MRDHDDTADGWGAAFWDRPVEVLARLLATGPVAYHAAAHHAARRMVPRKQGLIVMLRGAPDRDRWGQGRVAYVADLARAYGVTDVDGTQPPRFDPFS